MARYKISATELYRKIIIVDAASEREARIRARDAYNNTEFLFTPDDFEDAEFNVIGVLDGEDPGDGGLKILSKEVLI